MSRLTFVVEFEDSKEPPVHAHMEVFGGKVVAVAFRDALEEPEEKQWSSHYLPVTRGDAVGCPFNREVKGE